MEALGMVEKKEIEVHLTSAAAFVEGEVQDSCDDACSICLEAFSDSDELQACISSSVHSGMVSEKLPVPHVLAGHQSQRSNQPGITRGSGERERNFRFNPSRNARIFHHPTVGDFELQYLPVGVSNTNFEERIIQHLVASATAMERPRHIVRREGQRRRSSAQEELSLMMSVPPVEAEPNSASGSGSTVIAADHQGSSYSNRRSPSQSSPSTQDRAGPSDFQSFPESLKSRLNAVSTRYKDSLSKSTRGWKERWFSGNTSMPDLRSEVKREVNAGIATISRMIECLETRDTNRTSDNFAPSNVEDGSVPGSNNQHLTNTEDDSLLTDNTKACCAAGSGSN